MLLTFKKIDFKNEIFKERILFISIYIISHSLIFLISNAIYWDDWTLIDKEESIKNIFKMTGNPMAAYLHIYLLKIGPFSYRLITFLSYLISGLFLHKILLNNESIDPFYRKTITILFLILPFNSARTSLILIPYAICYLSFFIGWFFIKRNIFLSSLFLFYSFNVNSFLVFSLIPFIETIFSINKNKINKKLFFKVIPRNIYILLLPIIFWIIRIIFFKPYGIMEGYKSIDFGIKNLIKYIYYQFIDLKLAVIPLEIFLIAILFSLLTYTYLSKFFSYRKKNKNSEFKIFFFSLLAIFCAGYPYWTSRYTPTIFEWSSRHQLLFPLGFAIMISFFINIFPRKYGLFILSFIITLSITFNNFIYLEFARDWNKQKNFIDLIRNEEEIKKADLIYIKDLTESKNAIKRYYRDYEWNGIFKKAFGNYDKINVNLNEMNLDIKIANYLDIVNSGCGEYFNLEDFKYKDELKVIMIEIKDDKLENKILLNNFILEALSEKKHKYSINIENLPNYKTSKKLSNIKPEFIIGSKVDCKIK